MIQSPRSGLWLPREYVLHEYPVERGWYSWTSMTSDGDSREERRAGDWDATVHIKGHPEDGTITTIERNIRSIMAPYGINPFEARLRVVDQTKWEVGYTSQKPGLWDNAALERGTLRVVQPPQCRYPQPGGPKIKANG